MDVTTNNLKQSALEVIAKVAIDPKLTLSDLTNYFDVDEFNLNYNGVGIYMSKDKWGNYYLDQGAFADVVYIHGGGWVSGDIHTHGDWIVGLSNYCGVNVYFPEYDLAPDAKFPSQIMEISNAIMDKYDEDDTVIISGDSAGGNLAIAVALWLAQAGRKVDGLILYYPVTNYGFDTESYNQFADGFYLTKKKMKEFWDAYLDDPAEEDNTKASVLRMTERSMRSLPRTLILNGEFDVLRDDGVAFANKMREAGVECDNYIIGGMIHDFLILKETYRDYFMGNVIDITDNFIRRVERLKNELY